MLELFALLVAFMVAMVVFMAVLFIILGGWASLVVVTIFTVIPRACLAARKR